MKAGHPTIVLATNEGVDDQVLSAKTTLRV
jgi:hypothetical protein